MARICFYSDDSFLSLGNLAAPFVVAGLALDASKTAVAQSLLEAEARSGKGTRDWHDVRDPGVRVDYIERVLSISALRDRIFFSARDRVVCAEYWGTRLDVLTAAIRAYSHGGRCHHEVFPEGLPLQPRLHLREDLKARGIRRLTVQSAAFDTNPEVRCADALANYVRVRLFHAERAGRLMPELPDWLVRLP